MKSLRWLPALVWMGVIYLFSSLPSSELPSYGLWDTLVKKSAHLLEYALLALAYYWALGLNLKKGWLAWLLAVLYAVTDEFHQSFTAGRHPSLVDVLVYDNLGAFVSVLLTNRIVKRKQKSGV